MTLPALRLAENWITDLGRIAIAPAPGPAPNIVLVTITEETLATLPYRSPVSRLLLVEVVEKVAAAGGKGLALDILFDQPTEMEADRILRETLLATAKKIPLVVASAGQADRPNCCQRTIPSSSSVGKLTKPPVSPSVKERRNSS